METERRAFCRQWYVLGTVGIGTFLSSLNTSIINTVLPTMERSLNIPRAQSEWIVLIYLLVLTSSLVPIGRLSDLWGQRLFFLLGFLIFTVAAILCGESSNYLSLLIGRALLALGGAMILAVGPALISVTFSIEQRGKVLGLQALMTYIGLSLGPILGGWLTELWGWQATFFVTVPFSIGGLLLGLWALPNIMVESDKTVDWQGIFLFVLGMVAVTLLLNSNFITQYRTYVLFLLFIVFTGAVWSFIQVERWHTSPMIDLNLFRKPNISFGALGATLNYLCFFLTLFLIPFYSDQILHFSVLIVGMYLAITPLVMTVCAPIAGAVSDRIGPRRLIMFGMIMSILSLVLLGMMTFFEVSSHWLLVLGLIFAGLGTGTFAAPNNSAILSAAPLSQQGVASGILATFRYIGMMAGITIGGSLFDFLTRYFLGQGANVQSAFLEAFQIVMGVGAFFGILGFICAYFMTNKNRDNFA